MPQRPSYRRDLESQKLLLEQELYRLYGSDSLELEWVGGTLMRRETRRGNIGTSDQDRADPNKARDILDRAKAIATFYNPNQARDAHGRWGSGGTLDVKKAVDRLVSHAKKEPPKPGDAECATYVRKALEAGGITLTQTNSAKDYGPILEHNGFDEVVRASNHDGYPLDKYTPQAGDVVVIQPGPGTGPHGHMAMFSGHQWISDFKQVIRKDNPDGFWPGPKYLEQQPRYVIYRHKNK